jgi:tRNA (guanosine-2'-O-)-methyltransferase
VNSTDFKLSSWSGACDHTRRAPTDYFIPKDLQGDFGRLKEVLSPVLRSERIARFVQVASTRTRTVMPVFESTHHSHNISAVLRTADAFGFQDVSFVYHQPDMKFRLGDSVDRGSSSWLMIRRSTSIQQCAQALKSSGYKLFLVSLPTFSRTSENYQNSLPSFSAQQIGSQKFLEAVGTGRIALIFGNEKFGVAADWIQHADGYLHIEMTGFVESLNVSVCAGILFHSLRTQWLDQSSRHAMTTSEQLLLLEHWLASSCENARPIIERERPLLLPWFEFVRSGKFFNPF